jgi:hypothetical protein
VSRPVFPPQWFSQFSCHGNARWKPQQIFWVSLVMNWQPRATLGQSFEAACDLLRAVFPRWKRGGALSGFLQARQHWLGEMRLPMLLWLQAMGARFFEAWRVRGWLMFGVDGSRFETCRTVANEDWLGCAGKESTTPQVFQTTLLHIGTGLPWDFRVGPGTDSERRHLDEMLPSLPSGSLLTADAGFLSFSLCRWLMEQGHSFLLRVGSNVRLLKDLGWVVEVSGTTVFLWPKKQRRLPPVVLRLMVVRDEGRQPVFLVTNVFDEGKMSEEDAAELYRLRWGLELYYRSVKQTLGCRTLHSRTPWMSLAEQTWNVLSMWVLQWVSVRELVAAGASPASWSAAKTRDRARRTLRRALCGGSCRPGETFRASLGTATIDSAKRKGPKATRAWPRKKREKPPGPPQIRSATPQERKQAQQLQERRSSRL